MFFPAEDEERELVLSSKRIRNYCTKVFFFELIIYNRSVEKLHGIGIW